MAEIILCHKCAGTLQGHQEPLYGCGCISGYVRDFQTPVTLDVAVNTQIDECNARLVLYRRQGRSEESWCVLDASKDLAILRGWQEGESNAEIPGK